jgi:hypothetical protein
MSFTLKWIICVLSVVSFAFSSYATGSQEQGAGNSSAGETKKAEEKGEQKYLITDFEDPPLSIFTEQERGDDPNEPQTEDFIRLYNGPSSPIKGEYSTEQVHEGKHSFKVTTKTTDWSGIEYSVPKGSAIWSQLRSLKMWMYGSGSDTEIKVVVEDVKREQLTYSIYDNFKGWKEVSIPIGGFVSRTDWQHDDAITNGKIDYPVRFLHFFTTNKGELTVYYDNIYVTDEGKKKKKGEEEDEFVPQIKPVYTLKDLASDYNFTIGAAATVSELAVPQLSETLARDFGSMTAGNEMKFYVIRRDPKKWRFEPADKIVQFAEEHDLKLRGHTLVWHQDMPEWLENKQWKKGELLDLLKEYITTVATRYKGKVFCWDVVNEPFAGNGDFRSGDSVWYRVCGEEYIENAFIWAHEADPDAKLFLNPGPLDRRQSSELRELLRERQALRRARAGDSLYRGRREDKEPGYGCQAEAPGRHLL